MPQDALPHIARSFDRAPNLPLFRSNGSNPVRSIRPTRSNPFSPIRPTCPNRSDPAT